MMKKRSVLILLLWAPLAFCDTVSETLQAKLNAIRTMTASFKQVVKANKRVVSRSSGTMALARPGRFRWQTTSPMAQLVVADGEKLWVYDVELDQVTQSKQQKGIGGTAGLFLSGYDDTVTRDFDVTVKTVGTKEEYDLTAKSKKATFPQMRLIFAANELTGIELFDQLGQHTDVKLSRIKNNPPLATALFRFKIPQGVDVIKQ